MAPDTASHRVHEALLPKAHSSTARCARDFAWSSIVACLVLLSRKSSASFRGRQIRVVP
jgi:hypothetical protein